MAKIKVLYISSWDAGLQQGKVSFIYEQIEELKKKIDASYVTIRFESRIRNLFKISTLKKKDRWEGVTCYEYIYYRWPTTITHRTQLQDFEMAAKNLAKKNNFIKPDLIHSHVVLPAGLVAAIIKQIQGVPMILQEHSAPFEMHLDTVEKENFVNKVFKEVDKVIAVGYGLKKRLLSYLDEDKIAIIPEMLSTSLFSPKKANKINGQLRIVSVGALVPRKGYDLLIEAIAQLKENKINIHLSIAGEGSDRKRLENLIVEYSLSENVSLFGNVERTKLQELYHSANLYVHASEKETFGIAPAEALLCGIPVVTVICEGPEYYVNDDVGSVINNRSSDAIAEGILKVSANLDSYNPEFLHDYIVDRFGEKSFVKKMLVVYSSLVN